MDNSDVPIGRRTSPMCKDSGESSKKGFQATPQPNTQVKVVSICIMLPFKLPLNLYVFL